MPTRFSICIFFASAAAFATPGNTCIAKQQQPLVALRGPQQPLASSRTRHPPLVLAASSASQPPSDEANLDKILLPICLAVFVQMLGVGVTLATLPLMMAQGGVSPTEIGMTISCFSAAQMIGCPLLVGLSTRTGISQLMVLRGCLTGNALAALFTALATGWRGITCARILAGFFAASVPVAQVAVADVVPPGPQTSRALSKVASAASLGIVVGPAAGGLAAEIGRRCLGLTPALQPRFTFAASGLFAVVVLVLTAGVRLPKTPVAGAASPAVGGGGSDTASVAAARQQAAAAAAPRFSQPLVRWIALVCSYSVTTSVASYAIFAGRFLGYGQNDISLSQSVGAAAALVAQLLVLPRMLDVIGEAFSCLIGLVLLGACFGAVGCVTVQPFHFWLFVASRAGHALAETSNAAITASASTPENRGRNLALLQSFQSGSRLFSPLIASYLYELSLGSHRFGRWLGPPGALPFLWVGSMALLTAPAPLLLRGVVRRARGLPTKER